MYTYVHMDVSMLSSLLVRPMKWKWPIWQLYTDISAKLRTQNMQISRLLSQIPTLALWPLPPGSAWWAEQTSWLCSIPRGAQAFGTAPARMLWTVHGKPGKTEAIITPGWGRGNQVVSKRLQNMEQKFKMNFEVAKFILLPWGTSLQGLLLWEIKWKGNLLLLSWKPP